MAGINMNISKQTYLSEIPELAELKKTVGELESKVKVLQEASEQDRMVLLITSNNYDKLMSAFILATGAASMGMEVGMFFSFWGLSCLKKKNIYKEKNFMHRMVTAVLPKRADCANVKISYDGPR